MRDFQLKNAEGDNIRKYESKHFTIEYIGKVGQREILFQTRNQNEENINEVDLAKLNPKGKQMRSIRGNEIALIPQGCDRFPICVHRVGSTAARFLKNCSNI